MSTPGKRIHHKGPLAWMAKNTVAANILMWVCLLGGLLSFYTMRKELFPEFELDVVTISVSYPGASPEDVEQGIILSLEETIAQIPGISEYTATASEGSGKLVAEIDESENTQEIYQKIQQAVDRIRTFPEEAERPTVSLNTRNRRIVTLVVHGQTDDVSLRNLAEEVRDGLLAEPGITQVEISEVRGMEIHIEIPQAKLNAYGLSLQGVAQAIGSNVAEVSGGSIATQNGEILLRVSERRDFAKQFAELPIISPHQGSPILLGNIATVRDTFEDIDRYATFNGQPSFEINISRTGEQTPLSISDATQKALDKIRNTLPTGIDVSVLNDRADSYRQRVELLSSNALMGLALVMVLLTLFLDWKLAFWVSMGIPTAFLGAFLILPHLGVSFNMISMFAFIIALGIVVDDAIVAGENIYEYRQQGMSLLDAAIQGARDVAMPVTFSILTNIASFAPLMFIPGVLGKIWIAVPLVVCAVFIISLLEAMLILPAHLGASKEISQHNRFHQWQTRFSTGFTHWVERYYGPAVARCVQYRYVSLAIGIALVTLVIAWPVSGRMGFELFPTVESDLSEVRAILPLGSTPEQVNRIRDRLVESAQTVVQRNGSEALSLGILATVNENTVTVRTYLTPPDVRPIQTLEFTNQWRKQTGPFSGIDSIRFAADSGGPGSGPALSIELHHRDVATLQQASQALATELGNYPMMSEIDDGFQDGKQQYNFTLTEEAHRLGLSAQDIGRQIRAAFFGTEAIRQQRGRHEIKVRVTLPENEQIAQTDVRDLLIRTADGSQTPLHTLVRFNEGRAYASITRKAGRRTVTITANVNPRSQAPQIKTLAEQELLPQLMRDYPGLGYTFSGRQADTTESLNGLGKGFIVALLAIYVLLAVPFKSYLQPLIVMLAIPFGIVGAIVGHLIMGYSLSLISMMGIIALAGVVVNGSLVMVDYANEKTRQGATPLQAICASGIRRFRPIFLTTASTFLGLVPMIFETSRQARFMIPMALSLGFGVLFATAITLILVPCLYMVVEDLKRPHSWKPN